jgi:hypothetical protein
MRAASGTSAASTATPPPQSVCDDICGTAEAAALLGLCPRQAQKLAPRIGGTLVSGRWVLSRQAVMTYMQQRRDRDV